MGTAAEQQRDVIVFGGGVAGLWILNALAAKGYDALLMTDRELGAGQTLAAQGVIHGGLKYALGGKLSDSSEALKAMPDRWRDCLAGRGEIDLSRVERLSPCQYLWSLPGVMSQVVNFFGSKALSGRAERLPRNQYPAPFDTPAYKGSIFRLEEMVVNPPSLVGALAEPVRERLYRIDWETSRPGPEGVRLPDGSLLRAKRWIFAAGAGNQWLQQQFGIDGPAMQLRPLHQVMVSHPALPPLYSVCIGTTPKPPIVTTTHHDERGCPVWYLGGDLAETGVSRSETAQIVEAKRLLSQMMPWLDLTGAGWSTHRVDRAEPKSESGARVPDAFSGASGNTLTVWPSKLALAPRGADQALQWLADLSPASRQPIGELPLARPGLGTAPWFPASR